MDSLKIMKKKKKTGLSQKQRGQNSFKLTMRNKFELKSPKLSIYK